MHTHVRRRAAPLRHSFTSVKVTPRIPFISEGHSISEIFPSVRIYSSISATCFDTFLHPSLMEEPWAIYRIASQMASRFAGGMVGRTSSISRQPSSASPATWDMCRHTSVGDCSLLAWGFGHRSCGLKHLSLPRPFIPLTEPVFSGLEENQSFRIGKSRNNDSLKHRPLSGTRK